MGGWVGGGGLPCVGRGIEVILPPPTEAGFLEATIALGKVHYA